MLPVKTPPSSSINSTRAIFWPSTVRNCWSARLALLKKPNKPAPLPAERLAIWSLMAILIGTKTGTLRTTPSRTRSSALPSELLWTRRLRRSATSGTRTERCRKTSTASCTRLDSCPVLSAWCLVSTFMLPSPTQYPFELGPVEYVGTNIAGGVKPEEWDTFHEYILLDEMCRCGSGGVIWGTCKSHDFSLFNASQRFVWWLGHRFASCLALWLQALARKSRRSLHARWKDDLSRHYRALRRQWCRWLRTEAKKTADGKHYILNGEKKWITNGIFSDFFTVAVRTGGPGMGGVSLLLVERNMPGVTCRQMKCTGVWPSGTTYITFEDVKVPVENLVGKENEGFKYIMSNFNHEVSTPNWSQWLSLT